MGLRNKPPHVVECESAKDLKLKYFFSVYLFFILISLSQNLI